MGYDGKCAQLMSKQPKKAQKRAGTNSICKRFAFIGVPALLISILLGWLLFDYFGAGYGRWHLTIDDYHVSEAEFAYALDTVRNDAISETAEFGSSVGGDYWLSSAQDSPTARAVDLAIEWVEQRYAVYALASDCSLVDSPSWDSFIERMGAENAQRDENISSGTVIYGNQNYSISTFVDAEMRSLKDTYIAKECSPELVPTESELQTFYESRDWVIDGDTPASLDQVRANVIQEYRYEVYDTLVAERVTASKADAERENLLRFASEYLSS